MLGDSSKIHLNSFREKSFELSLDNNNNNNRKYL